MNFSSPANPYDVVPYKGQPVHSAHLDAMNTAGVLYGLAPAPPENCRTLELGCGRGTHLIPMAYDFPDSRFVGCDLAITAIEEGRRLIGQLGLANIRLEKADILDIDPGWGTFDYIIVHGVYSWVPEAVREKVLQICRDNLNPAGIVYISYNVYPGWRVRQMIREMLLFHIRDIADPQIKLQQARNMLAFLAESSVVGKKNFESFLKEEVELLIRRADWYLFHEYLEKDNDPVYFHQFVENAARHRLKFFSEAELRRMTLNRFSPESREKLQAMGNDPVRLEQYKDFLLNRKFRQSLLCREEAPALGEPSWKNIMSLHVGTRLRPKSPAPEIYSTRTEIFHNAKTGLALELNHPFIKAALMVLVEQWPQVVAVKTVYEAARKRLSEHSDPSGEPPVLIDPDGFAREILLMGLGDVVELRPRPLNLSPVAGERPRASGLSQVQIQSGSLVTNQRHEVVDLDDEFVRQVIHFLDGKNDRRALVELMLQSALNGNVRIEVDGKPETDPGRIRATIETQLEPTLLRLAQLALLEA
jgi:methyltransferase-like protein/trans-aconitate methyltransferase